MKIDKKLGVISFDKGSDDSLMKDYIDSLQSEMNWGMSFNQYKKWVEKSVLYDPGVVPQNESVH